MKKKDKQEIIAYIIEIVGLILVLLLLGWFIADYLEKGQRESDCLKEYAIKICEERNLSYSTHTGYVTFCNEDIRQVNSEKFKYNITERKACEKVRDMKGSGKE